MKRVFLASTALVMSAGIAAAEVSVGGDARMGVKSDKGADAVFSSRIRISFSASGETDNGLSFGGSIRADNAGASEKDGGSGANGMAGSVFVAGPFGNVSIGDTDSAAKAAVGNTGGVGYTGIEAAQVHYLSTTTPNALWDYKMGDLSLKASAGNPDSDDDRMLSGAVGYSIGTVAIGAGVERAGNMQNVVASASAGLGDANVKVIVGSYDSGMEGSENQENYSAIASFDAGAATFKAYFGSNTSDQDNFGIGMAYDLGGGASIAAGFADGDHPDFSEGPTFDLGITMGF